MYFLTCIVEASRGRPIPPPLDSPHLSSSLFEVVVMMGVKLAADDAAYDWICGNSCSASESHFYTAAAYAHAWPTQNPTAARDSACLHRPKAYPNPLPNTPTTVNRSHLHPSKAHEQ